ncbi:MAG: hypothetical protein Q9N67_11420 [Ghiorsea sp.]|nr:hypothetical protein [Ghiorsea sp.]
MLLNAFSKVGGDSICSVCFLTFIGYSSGGFGIVKAMTLPAPIVSFKDAKRVVHPPETNQHRPWEGNNGATAYMVANRLEDFCNT